ncbi:NF041680 family putative transposase [Streptomyces sp. NPDC048215]|uniref:NF041680 family putative transposase n=1 Tax=Streptomyces TaxID=1883 RepID=UPI00136C5905|nr:MULTISPECIES: NF041680 family putative transposase [Streptomyces]MYT56501.1 transposase [Streptomyces sp. SID7834]WSK28324.1 transposase [[Kitasatospora] papulosa]WSS71154.1 transposase [Streptomyces sp. NBC_01175]
MSLLHHGAPRDAFAELSGFRMGLYACLTGRRDALFELSDALLCADGPVRTLVELSLEPEHRRGHGALYGGLNHGDLDMARLRRTLAGLPLPRTSEGRLVLAVDVSTWSRPDANTSPDRMFCHTYGRGRGSAQMIPGWPYSFVAALEQGRTSWTALLDVVRLCPWDDAIAVTAAQVRDVLQRLYVTGQWQVGDPPVLVVLDAGYDVTRLAFLLADLPVELLGRMRSDRVLYFPPPPQPPANRRRKPKRGAEFAFEAAATQPVPSVTTVSDTTHYGKALASAWDRLHPLLVRRSAWVGHPEGELPVIEGTVVRLQVDHLRGDHDPRPVWLWWSGTAATADDVDRLWRAFLRRFDLEHTFRMLKQTLGWTAPKLREPAAADRWTWLVIAAHTQLRLARPLAEDLRNPWERPARQGRLTPARVRRRFRRLHGKKPQPVSAPKSSVAGPGQPIGTQNKRRAREHPVRKQDKPNFAEATAGSRAA